LKGEHLPQGLEFPVIVVLDALELSHDLGDIAAEQLEG